METSLTSFDGIISQLSSAVYTREQQVSGSLFIKDQKNYSDRLNNELDIEQYYPSIKIKGDNRLQPSNYLRTQETMVPIIGARITEITFLGIEILHVRKSPTFVGNLGAGLRIILLKSLNKVILNSEKLFFNKTYILLQKCVDPF